MHIVTVQPWANPANVTAFLRKDLGLKVEPLAEDGHKLVVTGMTPLLFDAFCMNYAPRDNNPNSTPIADFDQYAPPKPPSQTASLADFTRRLLSGANAFHRVGKRV